MLDGGPGHQRVRGSIAPYHDPLDLIWGRFVVETDREIGEAASHPTVGSHHILAGQLAEQKHSCSMHESRPYDRRSRVRLGGMSMGVAATMSLGRRGGLDP